MNIAVALSARAAAAPDAEALSFGNRRWSAAELAADVVAAAGWLAARPTDPGRRLAICVDDPAAQLIWVLAAEWIGATPAVLDPRWPRAHLAAALGQIEPALVIHDHEAGARRAAECPPHDHGEWISFTSGTSGTPRALRRTRESWTASFPAFTELTALMADDVVLVPGPLSSSMFSFAALHAVSVGAGVRLLSGWRPGLAGASQVTVAHLVPTMLADLLDNPDGIRPRLVVCAGAKLAAELERRARAAWPGIVFVEYYGSTEQSFVSARVGDDPDTVGRAFPGVRVEIRDDNGGPLPTGSRGMIWTRSPYAAGGYMDAGSGRFRQVGGWVSVGDRGRLDGTGVLTLLGRDEITTGGTTVDPAAVEAVLAAAPGVRDAVVLGLPHVRLGEVVAAVLECGPDVTLASMRLLARKQLGSAQRPRRWYAVEALPRTGGGKADRAALVAAVQGGRLRPLS
ncbi:MAG: class I adenylate-forming enzyme family protein [Geodermatophilaceae bacterium]